jgi:hypothetical protein
MRTHASESGTRIHGARNVIKAIGRAQMRLDARVEAHAEQLGHLRIVPVGGPYHELAGETARTAWVAEHRGRFLI